VKLTWKDPSDGGQVHDLVPLRPSTLPHFYYFRSNLREDPIHLSLNAVKAGGEYRTTAQMHEIVDGIIDGRKYHVT
jgi:hypothetical protein